MKERLSVYLDPHVMRSLIDYADRRGKSKSLLPKQRLPHSYPPIRPSGRKRRLRGDSIGWPGRWSGSRGMSGSRVRTSHSSSAFCFRGRPHFPREHTEPPQPKGATRYHAFIGALGRRLSKGPTLLREVSVDVAAAPESDESTKPVDGTRES